MKAALIAWFCIATAAIHAGESKWTERTNLKLVADRFQDGDSFTLKGKGRAKEITYRLYGVDCPESDGKDPALKKRIPEQAKEFKIRPEEILTWGKTATEFTKKLLIEGKPIAWTYGRDGEVAPGHGDRIYAIVEVTAPDGKRRMLHELLLESGLARAFGERAPWPADTMKRLGKEKTRERFMSSLETLEHEAKRKHFGIWKKP